MDLRAIVWEDVNRIHVAQDRVQRLVLVDRERNLRVSGKAGSFLTS
jgi:hypothetical protein